MEQYQQHTGTDQSNPRSENKEVQLKAVDKYRANPKVCSVLSGAAGHRAVPVFSFLTELLAGPALRGVV